MVGGPGQVRNISIARLPTGGWLLKAYHRNFEAYCSAWLQADALRGRLLLLRVISRDGDVRTYGIITNSDFNDS